MGDDDKPDFIATSIVPKTGRLTMEGERPTLLLSGTHLAQTLNSVSSVAPWIEQTSILALEESFKGMRDAELHVYANDDQPIGPRIGVTAVAEGTLKALANFERERRSRIGERIWWILGSTILAVIAALIGMWLK
jgi:hypothetical protein